MFAVHLATSTQLDALVTLVGRICAAIGLPMPSRGVRIVIPAMLVDHMQCTHNHFQVGFTKVMALINCQTCSVTFAHMQLCQYELVFMCRLLLLRWLRFMHVPHWPAHPGSANSTSPEKSDEDGDSCTIAEVLSPGL